MKSEIRHSEFEKGTEGNWTQYFLTSFCMTHNYKINFCLNYFVKFVCILNPMAIAAA